MNVLSLFDGMACGMLALLKQGFNVERYVAYEVDKFAVKTTLHNFPEIEQRGDVFDADFTEFGGFDFLIGGSPCTYWSVAQKNNRETEASGMGWELFSQYVRALKEAKPKYFVYENNKSMSKAIKDSISNTFGFEPICINSALVSAQNRQRLYWAGKRNGDGTYSKVEVEQPEDRGIVLRDILETSEVREIAYTIENPVGVGYRNRRESDGKLYRRFETHNEEKSNALTTVQTDSMIAEPVRVGAMPNEAGELGTSQSARVYGIDGKSTTLNAGGGGAGGKTGLHACPYKLSDEYYKGGKDGGLVGMTTKGEGKYRNGSQPSQQYRVYSCDGKSQVVNTLANENYVTPLRVREATKQGYVDIEVGDCVDLTFPNSKTRRGRSMKEKSNCLTTASTELYQYCGTIDMPIYEVKDGFITIKGKQYPIKLKDGFYIIRKLTVRECMRLQTVPEWFEFPVSDTQAYKMLGNGWTVDVIAHILSFIPKEDY